MPTIGLDIDEKGKPTAIAVVATEKRKDKEGREAVYRDIWFLERLSNRSGDQAMQRMAEIIDESAHRNRGRVPTIYANVTGPGKPALGMLRFNKVRPRITPVYLADGDEPRNKGDGLVKIGKGWLVSRLQEFLRTGRLRALDAARAGAEELKQELLDRSIGDEPGTLLIALGLAIQEDWSGFGTIRSVGGYSGPTAREWQARKLFTDALDHGISTTEW